MCEGHVTTTPGLGRRGFLAAGAALAGAAVFGSAAPAVAAEAAPTGGGSGRIDIDQISLQMFTVRRQFAVDPVGTIAALAEIGYTRIQQSAATGFGGMTPAAYAAMLADHGIRASSTQGGIPQPFDTTAWQTQLDTANVLGAERIILTGIGFPVNGQPFRQKAQWQAWAADLNRAGEQARAAGLSFGYHNHNHEFFKLIEEPDTSAFDLLLRETERREVYIQMDLFWAWRGGVDPVDYLRGRHGARIQQFHVKDMNAAGSFEDVGRGLIDFPRIFDASQHVAEFVVERDDAGESPRTPAQALDTARVGFEYLRDVRF
jgi:sugar phosphate isomerase/epimerase